MSKRSRKTDKPRAKSSGRAGGEGLADGTARTARKGKLRSWYEANRSDLRFLLIFGLCLMLYYLLTLTPPIKEGFFPSYLRLNARVSAAILGAFGEDVSVEDRSIISVKGPSIEIERGCDAVEPSALFVSAVMASPVPFLSRLAAAGVGTVLLMLLNLVRIVTLYLFRVYYPSAFEAMHLDVWQALFILFALFLWAMWASRAARKRAVQSDAST